MSNSPPKPSLPTRAQEEHAEFNWPPTDEELAQCFYIAAPEKEAVQGAVECVGDAPGLKPDPTMAIGSSTALETSAGPLGTSEPLGAAAITHEAPPAASVPERSEVPGAECSGIDDSTSSDIAVAKQEPPLDGTRRGDWASEIAQLQALIEALTENVEWRIPNATRR